MKIFKYASILLLLVCFSLRLSAEPLTRDIQIKEGARKIIKINAVTYLDQDPVIAKLIKTETPNQAVILGLNMGKTEIICKDKNNTETLFKVTVVPRYWDTLQFLFAESPNISLNITDGHLIISGKVIQNSLLKKVQEAVLLDKKRIINNVSFSHADLLKRIETYMKSADFNNVKAEAMDKTVYLSGYIFDQKKRDNLISVIESYVKPAGCTLNASGIHLSGGPLIVEIKFISVTKGKNDNVGLSFDDIKYSMSWVPTAGHEYDSSIVPNVTKTAGIKGTGDVTSTGSLNIQKLKSAIKVLYETNLSTRSGEKASLQRGGTIYKELEGVQAVDLKEINYGFIVEVTPTMINNKTIEADVNVQVSGIAPGKELIINKYIMKAKYTITPGEIILINKMNAVNNTATKQGLPIISDIPILSYLFDNSKHNDENTNLLLLLKISYPSKKEIRKKSISADKKYTEVKETPTHVDMNLFETLIYELEEEIEKELQ